MKTKRNLWFLGIVLGFLLLGASQDWAQPKPEMKTPVITHTFAVERGYYGYIWKIYIEAEDPDGDMVKIAAVADQPGIGHYPTDWIYLKSQYQKRFKGYLQWNTFSSKAISVREWTQVALRVSIMDRAGNESNVVVFPFKFEMGIGDPYQYELPAPFNEGDLPRLGYIFIELYK
jgi:hypothetical protein